MSTPAANVGSTRPMPAARTPRTTVRLLCLLVSTLATLSTLATATAQAESEFGRPGGYISGGVAGASEMFSGPFDLSGSGIDVGTALIVGGRLGYRANPYFAIEAAVDYSVEGFELTVPGTGTATAKALVATGNLKIYPGDWRIQPFILGGAGVVRGTTECRTATGFGVSCLAVGVSDSAVEFGGRVGGGIDFYLTRNIALSGEVTYVIPTGDLSDLDFLTYGGQVVFRF